MSSPSRQWLAELSSERSDAVRLTAMTSSFYAHVRADEGEVNWQSVEIIKEAFPRTKTAKEVSAYLLPAVEQAFLDAERAWVADVEKLVAASARSPSGPSSRSTTSSAISNRWPKPATWTRSSGSNTSIPTTS